MLSFVMTLVLVFLFASLGLLKAAHLVRTFGLWSVPWLGVVGASGRRGCGRRRYRRRPLPGGVEELGRLQRLALSKMLLYQRLADQGTRLDELHAGDVVVDRLTLFT